MPNYQNGKIYKIVSPSRPDIPPYYGATTQRLSTRLGGHKRTSGCKSKELIECGDAEIILVEMCPCSNKEELSMKEKEWILNNKCLNKKIPLRTKKEYFQDNKEEIANQQKSYNENHKEEIANQKKSYYVKNKEEIANQKKSYYVKNKDRIREVHKLYNEKTKDKMIESILCECGDTIKRCSLRGHIKTLRHQEFLLK